jgi:hypothetical protein
LRSFAGRSLLIVAFQRTGDGRDDRSDSKKNGTAFRTPVLTSTSKGQTMSKLSRRSLVSSAATLPALAMPAVASALPASADVELQQLGVQLLKENRNFDTLCADPNPDDNAVNEASGRIAALMPPIFSRTATTRDGLAVQAAAAAIACRELWDGIGDWSSAEDPSWQVERPFIEAVCRYTGVAHPVVTNEPANTPALDHSPEPDPIFAAIEAHKEALAAVSAFLPRQAEYEKAQWAAGKNGFSLSDDLQAEQDAIYEPLGDAVDALVDTKPTTLAGARALLLYVEVVRVDGGGWPIHSAEDEEGYADFSASIKNDWAARLHRNVAEVIGNVL